MTRLSCLIVLFGLLAINSATIASADNIWINEFHYDNVGANTGDFVEIVIKDTNGFGGPDLANVRIDLYDGATGQTYDFATLSDAGVTSTPHVDGGYTFYTWTPASIQNGSPDGIALTVNLFTTQFYSYEGSFLATDGPAIGLTSTDVGFSESDSTDPNNTIGLIGTGKDSQEFNWAGSLTRTPGAVNQGQAFGTAIPEPNSAIFAVIFGLPMLLRRRR